MKVFKSIVFGFVTSLLLLPMAHAAGGKVLNAERISDFAIEIAIETGYFCNSPIVTLNYLYTGNRPFGPNVYEVNVTPITRQACFGKRIIRATVDIPKLPGFGRQVLILKGDEGTSASVEVD